MMFRRTIFYFSITIVFSIASLTYFILTEKQNVFKLEEFPGSLVEDHNREKEDHFLCVLVPFRDRFEELLEFVPSISRFLNTQNISFNLVVIQQSDEFRFNKGSLFNAGFLYSQDPRRNQHFCDYIALHDVDLLPLNNEEQGVMHLSAPWLHPLYGYPSFIGGIILMQRKLFVKVDGFSNNYWGWGLEDDEFFARLMDGGASIERPPQLKSGKESTFKHIHSDKKRPRDTIRCFDQINITRKRDRSTGLKNVKYSIEKEMEISFEGCKATLLNILLSCDMDKTPWCNCSKATNISNGMGVSFMKGDPDDIAPFVPSNE